MSLLSTATRALLHGSSTCLLPCLAVAMVFPHVSAMRGIYHMMLLRRLDHSFGASPSPYPRYPQLPWFSRTLVPCVACIT